MSRAWVKLYVSILDDPKLADLPDALYRVFINLLAIAGRVDDNGRLGTTKDIAYWLRMDPAIATEQLTELRKIDITAYKNGLWSLLNWSKYQAKPPSAGREAVRDRVRKSRETKPKPGDAVTIGNVVTQSLQEKSNDPRIEEEENREEEKRIDPPAPKNPAQNQPDPVKELAEVFEQAAGIKLPQPSEKKAKAQVGVLWWKPLLEMIGLANGAAADILRQAISQMRRDHLTIRAPASALSVFTSLNGERHAPPTSPAFKDYA